MSEERSKFLADTASDITMAVMDSDSGLFSGFDGLGLDERTLQEVEARAADLAMKCTRRALHSQDEKGVAFQRIKKAEEAAKALADGHGHKHLLERAEFAEKQSETLRKQMAALMRSSGGLPPSAIEVAAPDMAIALLNAASIDPMLAQIIKNLKNARASAKDAQLAFVAVTLADADQAVDYLDTLHTAVAKHSATGHAPRAKVAAPKLGALLLAALIGFTTPAHAVVTDPVTAICPEGTIKREFFDSFVTNGKGQIKTDEVGRMRIRVDVKCREIMPKSPPNPTPEVYQ